MKPRILVAGSMNMDLVLQADRIPNEGESYFGQSYSYIPGGKGANQAAAASRAGADVTFVGRIGADAHGDAVIDNLARQGVSTNLIARDQSEPTGLAVIIIEPNGENRIMVYAGANMKMRADDLSAAFERDYDAVMINFEIPDEIIRAVLSRARAADIPVIVDAGPARPLPLSDLKGVEIISPNETETETLTGIVCSSLDEAARAGQRLIEETGARYAVIKLGERGALIVGTKEPVHVPGFMVTAVDTTAAGDAFTAAMGVRYLEENDIERAVRFGNAAGAVTVTRLGAQPSLPDRAEIETMLSGLL